MVLRIGCMTPTVGDPHKEENTMAKNTSAKAQEIAQAQADTMDMAQDQEQDIMPTLVRANRVAVSVAEQGFVAEFWRTHKKIGTFGSWQTGWKPEDGLNKSAQREAFRAFITAHAADIGIEWSPEDQRAEENKRLPKYGSDEDLIKDVLSLVAGDISNFVDNAPFEVTISDITVDGITPMTTTAKGSDLSKMGIEDGKYLKNNNWAWATIGICTTLKMGNDEIYVSTEATLVSGQLKKPGKVGDGGWTQTAWTTAIRKELEIAGLIKKEEKVEEGK